MSRLVRYIVRSGRFMTVNLGSNLSYGQTETLRPGSKPPENKHTFA